MSDSTSDSSSSASLPDGPLERALADDDNVLVPLQYPGLRADFLSSIDAQKEDIEAMVKSHMGVRWCRVVVKEAWRSGSFNVAIPIMLPGRRIVYLRVALPYRIGERQVPGNAEEKHRTEIAAYLWLQENCPDVPIPTLHAFGLPDGSVVRPPPIEPDSLLKVTDDVFQYTHPTDTPFWERAWWSARRWVLAVLGRPVPARHVRRKARYQLGPDSPGFLLLSEARGKTLAVSWAKHRHDAAYRERLFRGLARISLSMNAHPLPRIGSLSFCSDGTVALRNRPLHVYTQMFENEGIPSGIPRDRTYAEVEGYLSDLLSLQDSKLRNQPNAIHRRRDGEMQLAALAALRATTHLFTDPSFRGGPFYYTLTDLQQHNIFVDEHWNVTGIIDLEWAHSMPAEMQLVPFWLTSRAVDQFYDEGCIAEYEGVLEEYLAVYEAEEERRNGTVVQAPLKRDIWRRGSFWYFNAVTVPKGAYNVFNRHVQPLFNKEHPERKVFDEVFFWYWGFGARDLIDKKLEDKRAYVERVKEAFALS